ncbi:sensor histidine kinase [Labedella endophytica]|uniref:histidine kinase n=1 Tax=Labedella endophytica TaxID=1523160 RepID=A0A3S0VVU1_9MICO|nr:ATP-binding protein [Labedella endophytica]RUR03313.1 sensor histidine kinase KdpD [Labedella endophytica]
MARGRLHVLLGAAPGVGKTFAMLEEGRRLRELGSDVVIAVVESHGRPATEALAAGVDAVPRRMLEPTDLDLEAVIARAPQVALVDELARLNAPGSRHERRWQDVEALLEAGISVLTTVDVQHIESLREVVEQVTGVRQRETVPDAVLRAADRVELVDLAPSALRDRLAAGDVYPAERIDAALSSFFRLGTLTALRELALLWLADEVDSALAAYRAEHGIHGRWDARERVVVSLTGGAEGETLLRRGARIAARSAGGELLAVHVVSQDGLTRRHPEALAAQRALVESLGGTFHEIVGDDVGRSLVQFARSVDATQLVVGASRRSRLVAALSGQGIGATVVRESGDIDVHIVTHAAAAGRFALPRLGGGLSARRRRAGFALAAIAGPLVTALLVSVRSEESMTSDVLSLQLLVVVVALVGGLWPALVAAVFSGIALDFFFVDPLHTVTIAEPLHALALALFVVNALLVSYVVDQAARRSRAARRSAAESQLLATTAGSVLRGEDALQALVGRTREAFGLASVRLVADEPAGTVLAADGDPAAGEPSESVRVGGRAALELRGRILDASERRLLGVVATQLDAAIEHRELSATASELGPLAHADRTRSALLSAVSHDLRRPLASAITAVGGLRSTEVVLTPAEREELLATADESLVALAALVSDLLDVSRLQAGALAVVLDDVDIDDVILPSLDELGLGPSQVELDLAPDLPSVSADAALLQRVVVNILANAVRFSPPGRRVRVATSAFGDSVEVRVVDHGPGVAADRREEIFVPFQRLGDTDNLTGLGLGLALARGLTEGMGGTLEADDTPGGGLTMVVSLRPASGRMDP